jgi:mono/diheme cytochrome c family protein
MATKGFKLQLRTVAVTLAAAGLLAGAGGLVALYAGWYNVSAMRQHYQVVHAMFDIGLASSVRHHARDVRAPALTAQMVGQGALVYQRACASCHGGPGVAPADWAKGMQPAPGPLVDAAGRWSVEELYWLTRNGIRMSGMPAWEFHLKDEELWAVTAFVRQMPALSAQAYQALTAAGEGAPTHGDSQPRVLAADLRVAGDAARGKIAVTQYACQTCHMIPGVTGAKVYVGQPLAEWARRKLIAGRLPNTEANLVRWLMDPQQIDPHTAMPDMGVSERDARDIAAYLLNAQKR